MWDPGTGRFYLSIPRIGPNVEDEGVVRINLTGCIAVYARPSKAE